MVISEDDGELSESDIDDESDIDMNYWNNIFTNFIIFISLY